MLPREVTLVLCRADGRVLGALPPFRVDVPWWQEAGPVVDAARQAHGVDVTLLRLLAADAELGAGGPVTYLAEVDGPVEGLAPTVPLPDSRLRLPWARPGGPTADLEWAHGVLAGLGRVRTSEPRQVRTWNLSSVWRLPLADGAAWLKVVPPFLADEGALLPRLDPSAVPRVLAADGRRTLLDEVPCGDLYEATGPVLERMVDLLVGLQLQWRDRVPDLLGLGAADWRLEQLAPRAGRTLARTAAQLDRDEVRACEALVAGLPERAAQLATCGLPDTLVHGDFFPGNLRGDLGDTDGGRLVLLDWGDCGVGSPLLDQGAFLSRVGEHDRARVAEHWSSLWRAAVPGCDPERAAQLLRPVTALRAAVLYAGFLAAVEPSERVYHATDPGRCLREAAGLAG